MRINIKLLNNESPKIFEINENQKIIELQNLIQENMNIPINQQKLIFRGHVLQSDSIINECNLFDNCTIHLVDRGVLTPQNSDSISQSQSEPSGSNVELHAIPVVVNVDAQNGQIPNMNQVVNSVLSSLRGPLNTRSIVVGGTTIPVTLTHSTSYVVSDNNVSRVDVHPINNIPDNSPIQPQNSSQVPPRQNNPVLTPRSFNVNSVQYNSTITMLQNTENHINALLHSIPQNNIYVNDSSNSAPNELLYNLCQKFILIITQTIPLLFQLSNELTTTITPVSNDLLSSVNQTLLGISSAASQLSQLLTSSRPIDVFIIIFRLIK